MKKDLVSIIKETRFNFKLAQRELSRIELDSTFHTRNERIKKTQSIKDKIYHLFLELEEYRRQYRIRHILTSILRGKSISQIESKTKQDNESIKKRDKIYDDVKWHLDMCDKEWIE